MFIVGVEGSAIVNMDNCCALDIRKRDNHTITIEALLPNNNNCVVLGIYDTYSEACEVVKNIGQQMQSSPYVLFL